MFDHQLIIVDDLRNRHFHLLQQELFRVKHLLGEHIILPQNIYIYSILKFVIDIFSRVSSKLTPEWRIEILIGIRYWRSMQGVHQWCLYMMIDIPCLSWSSILYYCWWFSIVTYWDSCGISSSDSLMDSCDPGGSLTYSNLDQYEPKMGPRNLDPWDWLHRFCNRDE